jgi:hypothetical protein
MTTEIAHSATAMIRAHGPRAEQECQHMLGRVTRRGDAEGEQTWREILSAVQAMRGPNAR